jgi:hypothetical protein
LIDEKQSFRECVPKETFDTRKIDEHSFLTARNAKKRKGIMMSYHSCKSEASLGWRSAAHPSGTVIPNETDRREVEMRNPVID